jgi:hypothetical protein
MPENDFEKSLHEVETDSLFGRLKGLGVVSLEPYARARFASRTGGCPGAATSSDGLPELLDKDGDLACLIEQVGQEKFERYFLGDEALTDQERSRLCGISGEDARRLRDYLDHLSAQSEFERPGDHPLPAKVYSAVAGIDVEDGRPVLGFFNREIWKGRYQIDVEKREQLLNSVSHKEARHIESFLSRIEWLDWRKSTLYRVLEFLLEAQTDFFTTRDLGRRRCLTQRAVAAKLDIGPEVLNRLISNKSFRLPWGKEAPLKILVPSSKSLLRDRLYHLAVENPEASDEALRHALKRLYGADLSRRSVAQYRKELKLGGRGRRS